MNNRKIPFSIALTPELLHRADLASEIFRLSRSALIVLALEHFMNMSRKEQLIAIYGGDMEGVTDGETAKE